VVERWESIVGFEGLYEVSSAGRIRSLDRKVRHIKSSNFKNIKGKVIVLHLDKNGYNIIRLSKNGRHFNKRVARLVAEAFVPNLENKPHVNHIDGIKNNDSSLNLEWVTRSENLLHSCRILGNRGQGKISKPNQLKGVCLHKCTGKFMTQVWWNSKWTYLGLYTTKSDAYRVFHAKYTELYGFEPFDLGLIPND